MSIIIENINFQILGEDSMDSDLVWFYADLDEIIDIDFLQDNKEENIHDGENAISFSNDTTKSGSEYVK